MEIALSDLLSEEIRFLRRLEMAKEDLSMRYDYSSYSAFRSIDKYNDGYLILNNLNMFYRNFYSYPSEREILALIRRIDTDGDAKINYSEFADFMRSSLSSSRSLEVNDNRRRDYSESKRNNMDINLSNSTPLKDKRRVQSANKNS